MGGDRFHAGDEAVWFLIGVVFGMVSLVLMKIVINS